MDAAVTPGFPTMETICDKLPTSPVPARKSLVPECGVMPVSKVPLSIRGPESPPAIQFVKLPASPPVFNSRFVVTTGAAQVEKATSAQSQVKYFFTLLSDRRI